MKTYPTGLRTMRVTRMILTRIGTMDQNSWNNGQKLGGTKGTYPFQNMAVVNKIQCSQI